MRSSKQLALVSILLLTLIGCGGSGGSDSEIVATCNDLCERLDDCGTDFSTNDGEVKCDETCEDIENLEDQISGECQDAIVAVLECTDDLACSVLDDLDFTRSGRLMHEPPLLPQFTGFTNFPASILADPDCHLPISFEDEKFCPVDPDCVRFTLFDEDFLSCEVSPFDVMTMFVPECEAEYLEMTTSCIRQPLPF